MRSDARKRHTAAREEGCGAEGDIVSGIACPACGRVIAPRSDGRPRAHKPRKGALDNCPGGGRERCPHDHVRTLRSIPPQSVCIDCGAQVERQWVGVATTDSEPTS